MDKDSLEPEELKIVDKRRFTNEGESRQSEAASEQANEREKDTTTKGAEESKAQTDMKRGDVHAEEAAGSHQGEIPVDFVSLVMSLATQALVLLGEVPNPESNQISANLPAARQTIEILSMLEAKTKGNLTSEEEQLLREVLSSLRLTFASKAKQR